MYYFEITPFSVPKNDSGLIDPKTGKSVSVGELNNWQIYKAPTGNNDRNVPDPAIAGVYCKYDPDRCIPNQAEYDKKPNKQTC